MKQYEEYKSSDIKWLDLIPKHWKILPLYALATEKSICDCVELPLLSVFLDVGVIPFSQKSEKRTNATSKDLSKYQRVDPGDFILNNQQAWRGSVGVSFDTGIVSPAYIVLRMDNTLVSKYANYLFRSGVMVNQYLINSKGVGSIQRNLYWTSLKRVRVPIPPREEQDQIVRYLDWKVSEINKLIVVKKKEIALLEEQRQWVINNAVTHGIVNAELKESGIYWLGNIPKNWEVIKIKWLFNEAEERNNDGNAVLLTFSRKKGLIPFSEASDKEPSAADLSNYKLVSPGQLLENRMQAWSGMFICVDKNGCVSPDYSVFNPTKDRYVNVKFYEYVFRNPLQVSQFANASRGVGDGFNRLYTPAFGAIYTVYPPAEEQDAIVAYLDALNEKYTAAKGVLEQEIAKYQELKNKIISDVVTGQLDVRGVEIPDFDYVEDISDDEPFEETENSEEEE